MGRHPFQLGALEDRLPLARKTAECLIVLSNSWEHESLFFNRAQALKPFHDARANRANRRALLAVVEPQAATIRIELAPFQTDDLAAPRSGQGDIASDPSRLGGVGIQPTFFHYPP